MALLLLGRVQYGFYPDSCGNEARPLACFYSVIDRWLEGFPQTYFGFTNKVRTFSPDQIAALQNVEDSRLLLETDAPYFPAPGSRVSSPSQISTVAEAVAALRGTTVEHVLEISVANGKHLYQSHSNWENPDHGLRGTISVERLITPSLGKYGFYPDSCGNEARPLACFYSVIHWTITPRLLVTNNDHLFKELDVTRERH
ncbi:hypothetical protein DPMN_152550 [Dreissena polymorpha]|uniref:Uncharacterized protein n=1 Tax=Dreissena polymorpha TaxID=45954 RepID=A0A9D4FJ35_DREPO|nr:hypothetical protein DPMN_152550 [Dreissena polymorpha]